MNLLRLIPMFIAMLTFSPSVGAADSADPGSPIAPGATLQRLETGYDFTEGPACDDHGNVYFTDQPNDKILRWDAATGKVTTFLSPCGRSNGLCFDKHGELWACADNKNELWKIDPSGKYDAVITNYDGKLLNGPNDVWLRPDGGLYITDPFYKRPYWDRGPEEQPVHGVYYLAPDHKTMTLVEAEMKMPNGIIGTPDGKTLYVSDIGAGETYVYGIERDGTLTHKKLFCAMGSDGMTIDSAGNVYLTGRGVTVFDKTGKQVAHIPIEENWTGNICFGGADRKLLFITASTSIYGIKTATHGVGSQ